MASLDYTLFRAVNGLAGHVGWLDRAAVLFATWSPFLMVALVGFLWFRHRGAESERDREAALHAAIAAVLALLVNFAIAAVWFRARPFAAHDVHLLVAPSADPSFPSDHASAGFAIAVAVLLYDRRFGALLLAIASLMAIDRVFIGLHYPGDVIAGALIGAGVALALLPLRSWLRRAVRVVNVVWARIGLP